MVVEPERISGLLLQHVHLLCNRIVEEIGLLLRIDNLHLRRTDKRHLHQTVNLPQHQTGAILLHPGPVLVPTEEEAVVLWEVEVAPMVAGEGEDSLTNEAAYQKRSYLLGLRICHFSSQTASYNFLY